MKENKALITPIGVYLILVVPNNDERLNNDVFSYNNENHEIYVSRDLEEIDAYDKLNDFMKDKLYAA